MDRNEVLSDGFMGGETCNKEISIFQGKIRNAARNLHLTICEGYKTKTKTETKTKTKTKIGTKKKTKTK